MELRKPDGVTIIGAVILLALVGFIVNDFVLSLQSNSPAKSLGAEQGISGVGSGAEVEQSVAVQPGLPSQQVDAQPADGTGLLSAYPQEKREVPGGVRVSESIGDYN